MLKLLKLTSGYKTYLLAALGVAVGVAQVWLHIIPPGAEAGTIVAYLAAVAATLKHGQASALATLVEQAVPTILNAVAAQNAPAAAQALAPELQAVAAALQAAQASGNVDPADLATTIAANLTPAPVAPKTATAPVVAAHADAPQAGYAHNLVAALIVAAGVLWLAFLWFSAMTVTVIAAVLIVLVGIGLALRHGLRLIFNSMALAILAMLPGCVDHMAGYAGKNPGLISCMGKATVTETGNVSAGVAYGENGSITFDCGGGATFTQGPPPTPVPYFPLAVVAPAGPGPAPSP